MLSNNSNSAVVSKQQNPPPRKRLALHTPCPEHTNININFVISLDNVLC